MKNRKMGIVTLKKKITTIEFHFNNLQEFKYFIRLYEKKGYKILKVGAEEDWFFVCEKTEE